MLVGPRYVARLLRRYTTTVLGDNRVNSSPYIVVEYDVLAINLNEVQALEQQLRTLGPVRLRPAFKERGGDFTALWIAITYIGLRYIDAAIGAIAEKHFDKLSEVLRTVFNRKKSVLELPNACLKLSYDDFDFVINIPRDAPPDYCVSVARRVAQHFSNDTLQNAAIRTIVVPMHFGEDGWEEMTDWTLERDSDRYWGIGKHGCPVPSAVYDSVRRVMYGWFEQPKT